MQCIVMLTTIHDADHCIAMQCIVMLTCCLRRKTEALSLVVGLDLPVIVLNITCNHDQNHGKYDSDYNDDYNRDEDDDDDDANDGDYDDHQY